jgi:hypothetical protein
MRHIAHAESLFAGSLLTRANVAGAVRISARHAWRALSPSTKAKLVSVGIIPTQRGKPPGTPAAAEVVFALVAGPLSDLTLVGLPSGSVTIEGEARRLPRGSTPCTECGGSLMLRSSN